MALILHAGFHKTGSSSVQEFLFTHRDYIASHGLSYPQPLCKYASHGEIAWAYLGGAAPWRDRDYSPEEVWAHYEPIVEENTRNGLHTLLSNEDVSLIEMSDEWFNAFASRVSRLNPTVLFYVRDPVDYVVSTYHHSIAEGVTKRSFRDWLALEFHFDALDYRRRLLKWESAFGSNSIVVREYKSGHSVSDFLGLFSIPMPDGNGEPHVNRGVHPWFSEAYRIIPYGQIGEAARRELRKASVDAPPVDAAELYLGREDADYLKSRLRLDYSAFLRLVSQHFRTSL